MEKIVVSCLESRIDENQSVYSRFLLGPFLSGHAVTVATALRRALLSEVKNIAITALHIQGVTHEFSTLVGIRESVLELSLNFQQIILSTQTKSKSVQIGYLHVQGPAIVHANDLKLPDGIECVNPTQYIATLSTEGLLVVKFLIGEKKSFLKSNTSALNNKKIKEAKVYSAQLNKSRLSHAEYDPLSLFRLLRNQSLPNGAIVRETIESERASQLANSSSANSSEARGRVTEEIKTNFLPEPGSDTPPREVRASRQSTLFEKDKFLPPSVDNENVRPVSVAEVDSKSEPNLSFKEQNLVEPSSTKVEFITGSGEGGGRNEAASYTRAPLEFAGPVDKKGGSKQTQKGSLSSYRPNFRPTGQTSLPGTELRSSGLWSHSALASKQASKSTNFSEAKVYTKEGKSSARLTDSTLEQLANHTSDEFNSEVCLRTIIPLDPIFTPVYQVNFGIERDDLSNQIRERVIMEVWTNGSIHPRQAINEAALSTMSIFSKLRKTFQLDSHSLALSANSIAPLANLTRGSRLQKTKSLTKGVRNDDASESVEPLAALLSLPVPLASTSTSPSYSTAPLASKKASKSREEKAELEFGGSAKDSRAAVRGARVTEGGKQRVYFRRFALTKHSRIELNLTNSIRHKLNSFSSLGFVRSKHPVSLFLQNFGKSHIRGQTFILEQSFRLKARFFKGRTFTPLRVHFRFAKVCALTRLLPRQSRVRGRDGVALPRQSRERRRAQARAAELRSGDPQKLELRTVLSKKEYSSENEPLSAANVTPCSAKLSSRHIFKRTFLPSFKVVLGRFEANRNEVSAKRESIFSSYTPPNSKQEQGGLTKGELLFKIRFGLAGAQTLTPFIAQPTAEHGRGLFRKASQQSFDERRRCSTSTSLSPLASKKVGCSASLSKEFRLPPKGVKSTRVPGTSFRVREFSLRSLLLALTLPRLLPRQRRERGRAGKGVNETFEPAWGGSWSSNTSRFSSPLLAQLERSSGLPKGGKGGTSKDRFLDQVSIGLGRLLLVLSKYEQKGEHESRLQSRQTFVLAKAMKAGALIPRAKTSSSRSYLLSKKMSTYKKGGRTFRLSKNRLNGRFSRVTGWPNLRESKVTAPIAPQSETKQFACSLSLTEQLKPKPIVFLIKYRSFAFTRNAIRIFRSKQEDSLFLLPLAKQLIRVKMARVFTSCLPLISKRSDPSLPFSFSETQTSTIVDGENRVDVKQVLLSLAALATLHDNFAEAKAFTLALRSRVKREGSRTRSAIESNSFVQASSTKLSVSRQKKTGLPPSPKESNAFLLAKGEREARPLGMAERGLESRAPQKRIASLIALHTRTPFGRHDVPVSRFAASKFWSRSNLKKQFGFFQFACNGFRSGHQRDLVQGSRGKGLGGTRLATPSRELKETWMPEVRSALPHKGLERSGVCVNRTKLVAKRNPHSGGCRHSSFARVCGTFPYDFTTFATCCKATKVMTKSFWGCMLSEAEHAKTLPLIMTKAPPLCLSSSLVTLLSSLGPYSPSASKGRCSRNVVPESKSSPKYSFARVRPLQLIPEAVTDRGARVTDGGNRLSILYSSNLDKMSFLSSDLANLSLSLKTYTFLKKKGKNNIASLLEDSPNTLFSLLNGDENMFHEIERCLFFLGLPFKERSVGLNKV